MLAKARTLGWSGMRWAGIACAAPAMLIPIFLVFWGSGESPPSAAQHGFMAFATVIFQIAAGVLFSRDGVVSGSNFRNSIKRLGTLMTRIAEARKLTEAMVDEPMMDSASRRERLGELSVWMSVCQEDAIHAMEDWYESMPRAAQELKNKISGEEERHGR